MSAIQATDLVRRFGEVEAVRGVNLEVAEGEIYGFLGPNGAGKSTTVRMLCTLLPPTAGRRTVPATTSPAEPDDVRRAIGVALQEAGARPQADRPRAAHPAGPPLRPERARSDRPGRRADRAGRPRRRPRPAHRHLLGRHEAPPRPGRRRWCTTPRCCSWTSRPPASTRVSRALIWDEVRRLNASSGMTIFLTTQYLEEADELADRVGIIDARPDRRRGHPGGPQGRGRRRRDRRGRRGA